MKQEEDGFLYVPNLFSPAIVQDVFSKIAPQASLAFPNLLRVLESQNWSKLVREEFVTSNSASHP